MSRIPRMEFPQRHPLKPSVYPPPSDQHLLFVSQPAKSQPKEPEYATGERPSYRFRSDLPVSPSNTALGGKVSFLPNLSPFSVEQTDTIMMMTKDSSFPLLFVLYKEKLSSDGSNFMDWYCKLRIVLRHAKREYVLNTPLPPIPGDKASIEEVAAFDKHMLDEHEVQCLLLTCMGSELQKLLFELPSFHIIDRLKKMFQKPTRVERYEVIQSLLGCKMSEDSSVSAHMLKMMAYVEQLEKLGSPLSKVVATDIVFNSLPPSYSGFVMNYHMLEMEKSLVELHGMLKTAEADVKRDGYSHALSVNVAGKKIRKGKNKHNAKKGNGNGKTRVDNPSTSKGATSDTECFYCEGKGHWKRNCPKYLDDLMSGKVLRSSDTKEPEDAS